MHLEGYRVGTKKDTGGNIGDTGKPGIFRATSRDAEGHLGQTQGHSGATQGDVLEKYQGTRKDTMEHIKGERRDTGEDTGCSTKEKTGSTGHKSAQQQYTMAKCRYSLFCPFALHQVL